MKRPELLAPCGSLKKAKTAFMYGADAIYCGTGDLSLRARTSITNDELKDIIEYAHSIDKKVYVTLNIYANDNLYEDIEKQVLMLKEYNVDAIIASDGGVVDLIHNIAPEIPIHISTQANTLSYHTAMFWKRNGAERVILSREMNKKDIREVTEKLGDDLETEMFIHGAICWAYSGRCYLSDYMTGRNANSGDCAQSCRWKYNMYLEEKQNPGEYMQVDEDTNGTYVMSSKDLCLIKEIPEIIDMGVTSLKIEGRLKTEYYLASVVNVYRCAIDDAMKDSKNFDGDKYLNELEKTRTRSLTTFFFNDKDNRDYQEYEGKQYNDKYQFAGQVVEYKDGLAKVRIANRLEIGDELEMLVPNQLKPVVFNIEELYDEETKEKLDFVNPGTKDKAVYLKMMECSEGIILRKKI